jgi:2,3-diketo-5-methylthio-1-phosphopentane phosphatase
MRGTAGARSATRPEAAGYRVFIDFDNTITRGDVLDGIIERFALGEEWRKLEAEWAAGRIGARVCLDGQLRALRARWPEFTLHLDGVTLDPGFKHLHRYTRHAGIELTIVSDNFDLFVRYILERNGLGDVPFRTNHLECSGDRVVPSFPFTNSGCPSCAHCKKIHFLPPNDDQRQVVFIGDGRSDLCAAREADLVFAKAGLKKYLHDENVPFVAFDRLDQVVDALAKITHEIKS